MLKGKSATTHSVLVLRGVFALSESRAESCPDLILVCFGFDLFVLDFTQTDMEFLEVLTEGLERVLLVRGGGREVITIYS